MNLNGLTDKQVAEKIRQGKVNKIPKKSTNTIGKIILRNTLTIFNLVNLILALMIIAVGSYKNLLFIFIAIANTLISIINEVRAKRTIDKMRLISEQKPTVIRNGQTRQIPQDQIVEGDLIVLSLGDQIIVDSKIEQGTIEVNESFITGEQDNIVKHVGDKLSSGSFVVSGTCKATVTAVGTDNFISKLEQNAHDIKTANSKLFTIMNNIVKYISFALIPIGALLLWARFRVPGTTPEVAVTSTVAGLINMIPEGLILLTSSVLALATIRLSKKQVLVQDLYSVETLARVDCIALDKTGTLTTGKMTVKDFIPVDSQNQLLPSANPNNPSTPAEKSLLNALKLILSAQTTDNTTSTALKAKLLKTAKFEPTEQIVEIIPFSSDRKYSGVRTNKAEYLMGALEFITKDRELLKLEKQQPSNYRIISVVKREDSPRVTLLGFALLEDELRRDAKQIIDYFVKNDVEVKIISGDNLTTVQNIAKQTGVPHADHAVDLSTIANHNYSQLVKDYTIFTRVTPAQKKQLIAALKKHGKTVAMTGDGVNDILAMKEADCSIAIGEGSDAARRSAKLVLLNSDFAAVPSIIDEGRQSINNLERSTTLFLSKTVYASILAVLFTILPLEYPYAPIEMSLLNFACIGLPGVILALEHNTSRIKNNFVKNILQYSVPIGLTVSIAMVTLSIIAKANQFVRPELLTASLFITFAIDIALIFWISKPLNLLRSTLLTVIIAIVMAAFFIPATHHLLDLGQLTPNGLIITIAIIAASYLLFAIFRHLALRLTPKLLHENPKLHL